MKQALLGERICFLLDLRGMSKRELCEVLHIQPSTFSGYLSGKRQPSYETLMQIAEYFDTTCDYLLGYTPEINAAHSISEEDVTAIVDLYRIMTPDRRTLWLETGKVMCKDY